MMCEARVVEQISKSLESDTALAYMFVPVDSAAQFFFGVIEMEKMQVLEADLPVEIIHGPQVVRF